MNKYHNGKIYKIVDVGYNKCYIGSTCESLSQRMAHHRNCYNRYINGKRSITTCYHLFDEYGVDNCKIELVEYCKCDTKDELRRKEGEYIRELDCVNKNIAGRSRTEWKTDNREKIREQDKIYRENNPEKELKKQEKYRETHREEMRKRDRERWHSQTEKYECRCGSTCHKFNIKRHERSKKHQEYLKSLEQD